MKHENIKARTSRLTKATEKVILLSLKYERLGNHRRLTDDQFKVDANPKMISGYKRLLDSDKMRAVANFDREVRSYVLSRALPSAFKGGFWMLPLPLVEEVDAKLSDYAIKRATLIDDFIDEYPKLVDAAREVLNGCFNEADYKTIDEVRAEFVFNWRYLTFGVPEQLAAIKESVFAREKEKAAAHWAKALDEMQTLLRTSMADLVAHLVERLEPGKNGKAKTFKASTIGNLEDFFGTFDARNITDDKELAKLVTKAKALVKGVDATKLRTDDDVKAKIKIGMLDVKKTLETMIVNKPTRKIKYED